MTVQYSMEILPFCCGMYEAGDFTDDYSANNDARDPEEAVKKMMAHANGRPIIFNFVKGKDWLGEFRDQYDASELRTYVRTHKNALHVGKWINPGSQNRIDCYILINYLEGNPVNEDE